MVPDCVHIPLVAMIHDRVHIALVVAMVPDCVHIPLVGMIHDRVHIALVVAMVWLQCITTGSVYHHLSICKLILAGWPWCGCGHV